MGSTTNTTTTTPSDLLPYWQVNVPPALRTPTCPEFLLHLSPKDLSIISTPDSAYEIDSWPAVRERVASNRLDLFQRVPSQLRRYLERTWRLKQEHGSGMAYILGHRLHWDAADLVSRRDAKPFTEKEDDVKILRNHWPYGIDERIVHLVVWTKFALAEDPATGDLTDEARGEVDGFVRRVFAGRVADDQVIWFKNWASLKSVKSVEHFHVMVYDPDPELIKEITNNDVPLCEREDF
ncbi:hypothetical protein B0H63DRAFT_517769 [Podospora didyma]|uniref:N-acetylglucosamine-induced protein 1 n=1 Tax=Podospora didyma TaxID=330526 RepID=A0AAE0P7B7_9PEZI|nr:hypothetical protein B0H63DRAFT_517769 [Podospora didyma]